MAGGAVEVLLVISPIFPLLLQSIHPPLSLAVCCFFVFSEMVAEPVQHLDGKPVLPSEKRGGQSHFGKILV